MSMAELQTIRRARRLPRALVAEALHRLRAAKRMSNLRGCHELFQLKWHIAVLMAEAAARLLLP